MSDTIQHASLVIGVLDLFHLDHLGLFQHFHGVEAMVVLGLDEMDTTKATSAEGALELEVILRVFAPRGTLFLGLLAMAVALRLVRLGGRLLSILCTLAGIRWGIYYIVNAGGIARPLGLLVRRCL